MAARLTNAQMMEQILAQVAQGFAQVNNRIDGIAGDIDGLRLQVSTTMDRVSALETARKTAQAREGVRNVTPKVPEDRPVNEKPKAAKSATKKQGTQPTKTQPAKPVDHAQIAADAFKILHDQYFGGVNEYSGKEFKGCEAYGGKVLGGKNGWVWSRVKKALSTVAPYCHDVSGEVTKGKDPWTFEGIFEGMVITASHNGQEMFLSIEK